MPHPELLITIKRIGEAERNEYEATLTHADNKAEICVNTFVFDPSLLVDMEPQWMLDKAVPRHIDDTCAATKAPPNTQLSRPRSWQATANVCTASSSATAPIYRAFSNSTTPTPKTPI